MSAPRPKPWEVSSGTSAAGEYLPLMSSSCNAATTNARPAASGQTTDITPQQTVQSPLNEPALPERPQSLQNAVSSKPYSYDSTYGSGGLYGGSSMYGGGLGGYGSSMYGSSMYGGLGGLGGYGSRMGGYGSMYGSGYGMGGMYGGMGGYGGMYGGMGGMNGEGANGFAESTQATFQLIESIIGAFGGFAQMLEATYMATHSSFFTMISVAEQFGNLKNALGSFLGIFALIKYFKKLLAKVTGNQIKETLRLDVKEFAKFETKQQAEATRSTKRISLKPLLIFLAMVIGTPFILKKLVLHLAKQKNMALPGQFPGGLPGQSQAPIDIANIEFGRAAYSFVPENPQVEVELKEGDLVAILTKTDPSGNPSQWWRVRSRNGKTGYVPGNYLEVIKRKPRQDSIEAPQGADA